MNRQCSSCGGFCKQSGCERENVATNDTSKERVDKTNKDRHEPVAWRFQSPVGGWAYGKYPPIGIEYAAEPLYTAPPQSFTYEQVKAHIQVALLSSQPQRTWVGLTDEQIDYYIVHRFGVATKKNLVKLIRLCEAKLKDKNI